MVITKNIEDFPRSDGPRVLRNRAEKSSSHHVKRQSDQLFKRKNERSTTTITKIKEKKKRRKATKEDEENTTEKGSGKSGGLNKVVIEYMDIAKLPEGMVIYGCIQEIEDFEIKFNVTGGVIVKVPITNISNAYTKLIERFTSDEATDDDTELAKLDTIFQIGDYYPVKIMAKNTGIAFGMVEVIGSINPRDIYEGFSEKMLNNLPQGFQLLGAVTTLEDYGYGIDLGVENAKAFLSFEEAKKHHQGKLNIGQPLFCSILKADARSITLTNSKKAMSGVGLDFDDQVSINYFVPGTKVQVQICGIHSNGLELQLPGEYKGFVPRYLASEELTDNLESLKITQIREGTVLYVQSHTKQVCISLKKVVAKKDILNFVTTFTSGMLIKEAIACGKGFGGSMLFKLNTNFYGYCRRKNLCEAQDLDTLDVDGIFSPGSSHVCKVKSLNLFDQIVEVVLKKSLLDKQTLTVNDIAVGQKVEATIKNHDPKGIYVRLGHGLDGFVPIKHLTDASFRTINMERMFPLKSTVKARIMKVDLSSKTPRITLTLKKTLYHLPEEQIFSSFEDVKPGMSSTGVVCLLQAQGILVEFFSSVAAFIPLKNLATYQIEHPEKVFQLGQLVKCTIVMVNPVSRRMIGTLIDIQPTQKVDSTRKGNAELEVGQILKKLKIVEKVGVNGLDLANSEGNIKAFLPVGHLSDDPLMSELIYASLNVGDSLDKVMVFRKDLTNTLTVTKKTTFLANADSLVKSEDDIQLKTPFPAVVRNVSTNGIFFEIPSGACGVLRKKFFQDYFFDETEKLGLKKYQTIYVSAIETSNDTTEESDEKKAQQLKRFKFSMKLSDVWDKKDDCKVEFMKNYLADQLWVHKMMKANKETAEQAKKILRHLIGEVVNYRVVKIEPETIEMKIGNGKETVTALAPNWAPEFNEFNIDQVGDAVVCDHDFEKNALRLFIQPQPGHDVKHIKLAKPELVRNVKVDQVIKGTIIWVGHKHLLVCLGGHVPGAIAFVPARRHYNDCGQVESLFTLGSNHHFKIQEIVNDQKIIAVLSHETKKKEQQKKSTNKEEKIEARRAEKKLKKLQKREEKMKNKKQKTEKTAGEDSEEKPLKPTINSSSGDFQWDIPDPTPNLAKKRKLNLDEVSDDEESDAQDLFSDSDDDDDANNNKKRKTKSDLRDERKERETKLRDLENHIADPDRKPMSEQDHEMAVIAQPNSSMAWLRFMSFYLENGNVQKAREVAQKAIDKISFREEKEKLNIWIGWLNLENSYGDQASMDSVLEKALKYNDPKNVYLQLASIYDLSNKQAKADEIHLLTIKKFKQDKTVWIEYLVYMMKNKKTEAARKLFQKSLLSLEKRDHVDVISKFAQLEFKFGDCEQAKTIFEQMLATYWKRLDQWSIYIDMLVKYTIGNDTNDKDSIEYVRNVFERLVAFKFSPERMKFVFKKYYGFETKFTPENSQTLERIKKKAIEYAENEIF